MAQVGVPAPPRRRTRGLTLPIDTERETRWALVELLYCVQRDVRKRWRSRSRRWWRFVAWVISAAATSAVSVVADHHVHLLVRLFQSLSQI